EEAECKRGADRPSGARIGAPHDACRAISSRVKARDGRAFGTHHATLEIRDQSTLRSQIAREDFDGVEWTLLNRAEAGVGLTPRIAIIAILRGLTSVEVLIDPRGAEGIEALDGGAKVFGRDAEIFGKRLERIGFLERSEERRVGKEWRSRWWACH